MADELELTLRVAVMMANGMTRMQMVNALAVTDLEVRAAQARLKLAVKDW